MPNHKKPTKLRLLQGNPGKVPINKNEPMPDPCIPEPMSTTTGLALEEWKRITPILARLGLMSDLDLVALAMYCDAVRTWREAQALLECEGLVIETTNGNVIQNPLLGIRNTAIETARKLLVQFGMSPSSRASVTVSEKTKSNPLDKFKAK